MIEHQLELDYTLAPGWMKPFVDGVLNGEVRALKCASCAQVSFPPVRICPCGASKNEWVTLTGYADIVLRTEGTDGIFALVQFDGADTHSVVRVDGLGPEDRGKITKPDSELPMLVLTSIKNERNS